MNNFKKLLLVGLLACPFVKAENPWENISNLFERIDDARDEIAAANTFFQNTSSTIDTFANKFTELRELRKSTKECILARFDKLNTDIADCAKDKAEKKLDIDLRLRDLTNELNALKTSTDKEIAGLNTDIRSINLDLDKLRTDFTTLEEMNSEKVAGAIVQLEAIRTQYAQFLTDRVAYQAKIEQHIKDVLGMQSGEKEFSQELIDKICKSVA